VGGAHTQQPEISSESHLPILAEKITVHAQPISDDVNLEGCPQIFFCPWEGWDKICFHPFSVKSIANRKSIANPFIMILLIFIKKKMFNLQIIHFWNKVVCS